MKALLILVPVLYIAGSLNAKTIRYPEQDTVFTITLPDDWTTELNDAGSLHCEAGDGSTFSFLITTPSEAVRSDSEMKAYLPKFARNFVLDARVGEIKETTTAQKLKLFAIAVSMGETEKGGGETVLSLTAFAPKKGAYFIILAANKADLTKTHAKTIDEIINSITPAPGGKTE
jgi:hypothetical protein